MPESCPACKSANLEQAAIVSAAIQLDRASTMKKLFAAPEIKATVCMDCGHIGSLRADPAQLAKLLPPKQK
ncbi:MAG: hypothetical protein IT452_23890 [Planctomycetia bacterium]|nr:hypothetical protein [Planctomycetia bacterium]